MRPWLFIFNTLLVALLAAGAATAGLAKGNAGDLGAICVHSGRVSQAMPAPWAREYWALQQAVAANPALTNTLSPDITQGTLPYLMGLDYYERWDSFRPQVEQLHKVRLGAVIGQGLSIVAAQRTTGGALVLPLNLVHPHVDMHESFMSAFGNSTLRPDEGYDLGQMADSCLRLYSTEGSAQEHKVLEDFYGQAGAISSVRLLLQAQQAGQPGMAELSVENYLAYSSLASYDASMWAAVTNVFAANQFANVYITLAPVTSPAANYQGMGCLIYSDNIWQALISNNGLPANGGYGGDLTQPIYNPLDFTDVSLTYNTSVNNDWSVGDIVATASAPAPLPEIVATAAAAAAYNNFVAGFLNDAGNPTEQTAFTGAEYDLGYTGTGAPAATYADAVNNGGDYDAHVGPAYAQVAGAVADPVNAVTGEFYSDSMDLALAGPMPIFVKRNYSSQDVDLGDAPFGYGWRPAYTPYLRLVTNNVIYAAEMDGTVVAYRQPITGTNFWKPLPADNPQLNNHSSAGIGSTANLFNNYITTNFLGGTTNYVLTGADGSVRQFRWQSFPLTGTNNFNRSRPYLQTWTDANGNSYSFTYQTDSTQPDYGQLLRVQSSNGNFFGFDYDVFAHIIDAYTGDGRYLYYDYDEHGDLVTVTLPDDSEIDYVYQHTTIVTNSTTNIVSTHLLVQEQKPDGRVLANTYDSLRRVIIQAATVGTGLNLVTNATFLYANTFTNLTNSVITGASYIADVFGRTNVYLYTNNLITSIQDPLNQTVTQVWFANTNDTGYYPNSLKSSTDKRGLNTAYQYDTFGNIKQMTLTGNLTGTGVTNETAVYAFTFTTNNVLSTTLDPSTNETAYYYTNGAYPFLPTTILKTAQGVPVATNQFFYTSATQVVTNGAVFTNRAYGLVQRRILGSAATNDLGYNGAGLLTAQTNYSGTGDPAVVSSFLYSERGELIAKTDAAGRSHVYAYDDLGRKISDEVYEANAEIPEGFDAYYYNENGEVTWTVGSRYNPQDYVWYDYDGAGRKITEMRWLSEANPSGSGVQALTNVYAATSWQYDAFSDLTQITDPLGNYTVRQYDAIGQLTNEAAYSAAGVAMATNLYAYEPGGLKSRLVNPLGGVTTMQYNSLGKVIAQSNPNGSTNSWQYYPDGRVRREYLDNGNYWETIYNDAQSLTTRNFHNGSAILETTSEQKDARGNVIQTTDAGGNVFATVYDGLNRVKATIGPAITSVDKGYPGGNPLATPVYTTNLMSQAITNYYDAAGLATTNVNALGESTVTLADALGRTTQVAIFNASNVLVRLKSLSYSADHNSVTIVDGSGAAAITNTTYTDTEGHPLLTIAYPSPTTTEFTLNQYDLAGNLIASQHDSSGGGAITPWTTNGYAYDGLNRCVLQVDRDGAATTNWLDALGNLTNRAIPGGVQQRATYNNAGQKLSDWLVGGTSTTRNNTYTYFASGSPFAGLRSTMTDGRGVTCTYGYDNWLRVTTNAYTGALPEQNFTTITQYELRGYVTNYSEHFASTNTGPNTSLIRYYNAYGQVTNETVTGGPASYANFQTWDAAGRRTMLDFTSGASYGFGSQADGSLIFASNPTGSGAYTYNTAGLLTQRQVANRITSITARDGEGRPLNITNTLNAVSILAETLAWSGDGLLTNHTLVRGDMMTDHRLYSYAPLSRRLTQEQLNLTASTTWTDSYIFDRGVAAGPGALTTAGPIGAAFGLWWSGIPDAFSRVNLETNNSIGFLAYGFVNGQSTLSAWLDSQPIQILDVGTNMMQWRTFLELSQGGHQLQVNALHPSGFYTAAATNVFTNNIAYQATTNTFDGAGNITNRVFRNASGSINRTQAISYDARNRVRQVIELNTNNYGFIFSAVYDGLDRRISTTTMLVSNGVPSAVPPQVLSSYYDPQADCLELGVLLSTAPEKLFLQAGTSPSVQTAWKLYGPDLNGIYGGENGTGGLEGVSPYLTLFNPAISDARGNVLAEVTNGVASWILARPSAYGTVPDYRAVAYGNGADLMQSSVYLGREVDATGWYYFHRRYLTDSHQWSSYDPRWNPRDPNGQSYSGGDPVNGGDWNGLIASKAFDIGLPAADGIWNFGVATFLTAHPEDATPEQQAGLTQIALNAFGSPLQRMGLYDSTPTTDAFTLQLPAALGQPMQNLLMGFGAQPGVSPVEVDVHGEPTFGAPDGTTQNIIPLSTGSATAPVIAGQQAPLVEQEEQQQQVGNPAYQSVNLSQVNIVYREDTLYQNNINAVTPFNQEMSDAQEPIQAVRTPDGTIYIMQGNNRVWGAMVNDQTINMSIYTPAQWNAKYPGLEFNPNYGTPNPTIVPGTRNP